MQIATRLRPIPPRAQTTESVAVHMRHSSARQTAHFTALLALLVLVALIGRAEADPAAWRAEWPVTDFSRSTVEFSSVLSGGPPRDGIPSIDAPLFRRAAMLKPKPAGSDPVISVEIGGDARAYPLSVLMWHEIVNDSIAGVPIAVTYCPLCNSGIVFDRRVGGKTTTFGTTGKLRKSNLIMYDRTSESWWQQFDGAGIVGKHAGRQLDTLPGRLESFAEFAARNPQGMVLVPDDRNSRAYGRNPYVGYDGAHTPFLYDGTYDGPGDALMRVVTVEGQRDAWSLDLLRRTQVIRVGDIVLRWSPGQNSALDTARIAEGRDVGTVTVERVEAGGMATPLVYHIPFAFAFRAFNPGATIHHR